MIRLKTCGRCKEAQPLEAFHRDVKRKDGLACWCRNCCQFNARRWYRNNSNQVRDHYRSNRDRVRATSWRNYLRRTFGLTPEEYAALKTSQEACGLCEARDRPLVLDHNHETGEIRKFLCSRCNIFVGNVERYPGLLKKIQDYLFDD